MWTDFEERSVPPGKHKKEPPPVDFSGKVSEFDPAIPNGDSATRLSFTFPSLLNDLTHAQLRELPASSRRKKLRLLKFIRSRSGEVHRFKMLEYFGAKMDKFGVDLKDLGNRLSKVFSDQKEVTVSAALWRIVPVFRSDREPRSLRAHVGPVAGSHRLCGTTGFERLPRDRKTREGCNDNNPPIRSLES
jgi:hypothetical protein